VASRTGERVAVHGKGWAGGSDGSGDASLATSNSPGSGPNWGCVGAQWGTHSGLIVDQMGKRKSDTLDITGSVIRFENVTMRYRRQATPALSDVSCGVQPGEFLFIVGPSGSGKSTFLRLLLREEVPTAGRVLVAGADTNRLRSWQVPKFRRKIGAVFQDFRLLPNKSVYENVAFASQVIGKSAKEIKATVPPTLDMVGLADKAHRRPDELSAGEQQRVAIARAFVNRPPILIADEPTGNLDPLTSVEIMRLLDRINRMGTTVLMATHDSLVVDQMRKRVIELGGGRVVRDQARGVYGSQR